MRKFFFLIVLLSFATGVFAQDIIVTTDGDVLKAYNIEIASNSVYFKTENKQNAAIQSLKKENIVVIKYANGTKKNFKGEGTTSVEETQQTVETPSTSTLGQVSEQSSQSNKAKINKINSAKAELKDYEKITKGVSNRIFGTVRVTEDSQLENDDVEIEYGFGAERDKALNNKFGRPNFLNETFRVNVKNKTRKTLYLNMGNTFFTQNGLSTVYYIPTASTTTSMSTSEGAPAGISAQNSKSVAYANSVVAVPPLSSVNIADQFLFANVSIKGVSLNTDYTGPVAYSFPSFNFGSSFPESGYVCNYKESESPIKFGFMLTYSDSEDFRNTASLVTNFYLGEVLFFKSTQLVYFIEEKYLFDVDGLLGFWGYSTKGRFAAKNGTLPLK